VPAGTAQLLERRESLVIDREVRAAKGLPAGMLDWRGQRVDADRTIDTTPFPGRRQGLTRPAYASLTTG